jgi:m7GpppX diphosphatase
MTSKRTPKEILSSDNCKLQSLTVSDQHATLLISHPSNLKNVFETDLPSQNASETNDAPVQSLLKLTIVPFHKSILGCNSVLTQSDILEGQPPERNMLHHDHEASRGILSFLRGYDFELKSESGAEYSYYAARPNRHVLDHEDHEFLQNVSKEVAHADDKCVLGTASPQKQDYGLKQAKESFGSFDVELISPATPTQISRAMPALGHVLIQETPQLYMAVVRPYIQSIVDGGSLNWITNVIELKKEKERLLYNCDQFIINIDTKWRSHPPPLTTAREFWHNHPSVVDLYCLAITKLPGIASLRDLRKEHIPMLRCMFTEGLNVIKTIYGVENDQIRVFIHYQPQFYHFHVHFTRLENEVGCSCEKGHLLCDVIQNLEIYSDFYAKRTIAYKLKRGTPLENIVGSYFAGCNESAE